MAVEPSFLVPQSSDNSEDYGALRFEALYDGWSDGSQFKDPMAVVSIQASAFDLRPLPSTFDLNRLQASAFDLCILPSTSAISKPPPLTSAVFKATLSTDFKPLPSSSTDHQQQPPKIILLSFF
ncbi:uncharacterized protein A4U43_UnF9370 [Asparagus officinalis]|uniref:Uncharacterized protein n=1 Tax=Asparagus officinalis TaxID=4686 RepID=A0A1R3L5R1_ASPOF|nr:uncharacterized protein A4U43_UnF9370 [Asparagus officinalis]